MAIVAICAATCPPIASAQSIVPDLAGRWSSERLGYVLDIVRCGAKWCGVRINADKSCGAKVMELVEAPVANGRAEWTGTLTLEPAAPTYQVRVAGGSEPRPAALSIVGSIGRLPNPMTRVIPFHDRLARDGDAACRADGTTS